MKRPGRFQSTPELLARILEIAREQRECLGRGDLDAVQALQARRQELLAGIQSLDNRDPSGRETLSEILCLDRQMGCLLLSELVDIQYRIQTIASLRKLLRSRFRAERGPTKHLSRRI